MSASDLGTIDIRCDSQVAMITLNRPAKLNALTATMIFSLREALTTAQADAATQVILLRGEGRAFCAGDDVDELAAAASRPGQQAGLAAALQDVTRQIMRGKPVVAVLQGWAVGAAFSWLLNCDLVVSAQSGKAFFPEVKWGVSPTGGATVLAPRLLGAGRAREALLLSRRFSAQELFELGCVTRLVADGEELSTALSMAQELAQLPAFALCGVKRLVNQSILDLEASLADEAVLAVATATRDEVGRRLSHRAGG